MNLAGPKQTLDGRSETGSLALAPDALPLDLYVHDSWNENNFSEERVGVFCKAQRHGRERDLGKAMHSNSCPILYIYVYTHI